MLFKDYCLNKPHGMFLLYMEDAVSDVTHSQAAYAECEQILSMRPACQSNFTSLSLVYIQNMLKHP